MQKKHSICAAYAPIGRFLVNATANAKSQTVVKVEPIEFDLCAVGCWQKLP